MPMLSTALSHDESSSSNCRSTHTIDINFYYGRYGNTHFHTPTTERARYAVPPNWTHRISSLDGTSFSASKLRLSSIVGDSMIHRTFYLMHADLPRMCTCVNRFILGQNGVFVTKNSNGMLMTSGTLHSRVIMWFRSVLVVSAYFLAVPQLPSQREKDHSLSRKN